MCHGARRVSRITFRRKQIGTSISRKKHDVAAVSRSAILIGIASRRNVSDEDGVPRPPCDDAKDISGSTAGTDSAEEQVQRGFPALWNWPIIGDVLHDS